MISFANVCYLTTMSSTCGINIKINSMADILSINQKKNETQQPLGW